MPPGERHKQRRARNIAVAALLVAFVVLFFFVTLAKLGWTP